MTERERLFVEAYMGQAAGNGARAAVLAGYSPATARNQASRLLTKDDIRSAIEERSQGDPLTWTREERQRFWTKVAADESLEIRDRLRATELLARSQGDFIEKRLLQVEGNGRLSLAELIVAGSAPTSPRSANGSAWEAPRDAVAHPRDRAVSPPTPSPRESPVAPGNGRDRRWDAERTVDAGSSRTDFDPFA